MNPDILWRYAPSLVSGFGVTVMCWSAGGALGLLLGVFVVLVGHELLPQRLRFVNYKPYMRGAYALYMLGTVMGVVVYVVVYGGGLK